MTSKYPKIKFSSILIPSLESGGDWKELSATSTVFVYSNGEDVLTLQLAHSQSGTGAVLVYAPVDNRIPIFYRVQAPCHSWKPDMMQKFEDKVNASMEKVISGGYRELSRTTKSEMKNLIHLASLSSDVDSLEYLFDLVSNSFAGDRKRELDGLIYEAIQAHPAY